jgi:hypothetical protein
MITIKNVQRIILPLCWTCSIYRKAYIELGLQKKVLLPSSGDQTVATGFYSATSF